MTPNLFRPLAAARKAGRLRKPSPFLKSSGLRFISRSRLA